MKDYLEIQFWKIAKWLIRRGYGADCPYSDPTGGCPSCNAQVMITWIDNHIELLKLK